MTTLEELRAEAATRMREGTIGQCAFCPAPSEVRLIVSISEKSPKGAGSSLKSKTRTVCLACALERYEHAVTP